MRIKPITQEIEPGFTPGPRATPNLGIARGFAHLGGELEQASGEFYHIARLQHAADERMQTIDNHDSAFLISTDTQKNANDVLELIGKMEPANHEQIRPNGEATLKQVFENARERAAQKNPDVLRRVELEIARISPHSDLALTKIKNEKWKEYHLGELAIYQQYVEDTAPTIPERVTMPDGTTTTPRLNFMQGWNQKIDEAQKSLGLITPQTAQKMKEQTRENVAVNTIKLQGLDDPLGTMEKLATGQIGRDLPTDKIALVNGFLETQLRMRNAQAERDRIAGEREIKQNQKDLRNMLQGMVENGDGDSALFHAGTLRDQGFLDYDDVTWVRGELKAYNEAQKKEEAPENDAQIKQIYTLIDQGLFAEAKKLAAKTDMKPGTYSSILNEIRGIQNNWETKATTDQKFRHSQGKGMLSGSLGIIEGQLYEKIEPVTKEVYDLAMREFTNRSAAMGGKDDPVDLANEIIPKYQDILLNKYQIDSSNYQRLLKYPENPARLEQAYKNGEISKGEYDSQWEIIYRLRKASGKEEEARALRENSKSGKVQK